MEEKRRLKLSKGNCKTKTTASSHWSQTPNTVKFKYVHILACKLNSEGLFLLATALREVALTFHNRHPEAWLPVSEKGNQT